MKLQTLNIGGRWYIQHTTIGHYWQAHFPTEEDAEPVRQNLSDQWEQNQRGPDCEAACLVANFREYVSDVRPAVGLPGTTQEIDWVARLMKCDLKSTLDISTYEDALAKLSNADLEFMYDSHCAVLTIRKAVANSIR